MDSSESTTKTPLALVVDDDRFMRATLRQTLEESGYAVIEADSGAAALARVRQSAPDVVLLDIVMPGMDGFETCAALRRLPEGGQVPVLMVTALEDAETINRAYVVGATDYVPKPVNASLLRHHLRYVLRASRLYGELQQKEARLADAQRIARLGNWDWSPESGKLRCSQEARLLLGLSAEYSPGAGAPYLEQVHPDDREAFREAMETLLSGGEPCSIDHRIVLADGTLRFVHTQAEAVTDRAEKHTILTGTIQDITDRKLVEEKLRLAGKVFDHSGEMILITDARADIIDVNPAFCQLTGYSREEIVGINLRTHPSMHLDSHFFRRVWDALPLHGSWQGELWNRRKDGESFPALVTINAVASERGEVTHYVAIATDISKLRETEKRLEHLANFDPLTDLPNRVLLNDRFEQVLIHAARSSELVALLLFDLDNFKEINETFGHQAGDRVLQMVAKRVGGWIRKSDTLGRLGSDEFAVILRELNHAESGALVAQRIMEVLAVPFFIDGKEFFLSASLGIALYPDDGSQADELTKKAETALNFAKQQGKNRYQFFSAELNTRNQERLLVKSGLRRALERNEFLLHYQPKFDSQSGSLTGMEALVRWQHPERGLVPPLQFIPIAEETGLIVPLGEHVLRLACIQNRVWRESGYAPFRVAVNLSTHQFRDRSLVDTVLRVLEETGLDCDALELEITESALMQDPARAIDILRRLREAGIRIALDDFGTGYSSLSYLRRFPVDALKIDYSFIRNIFVNAEDASIVKAIIGMAHSLKLKVVAEGVETEEQRVFLREQGCDEVQGYRIILPAPAAEMEQFLTKF